MVSFSANVLTVLVKMQHGCFTLKNYINLTFCGGDFQFTNQIEKNIWVVCVVYKQDSWQ